MQDSKIVISWSIFIHLLLVQVSIRTVTLVIFTLNSTLNFLIKEFTMIQVQSIRIIYVMIIQKMEMEQLNGLM